MRGRIWRNSRCGSFFFSSRRRHTRSLCDWSSDVCSSDLAVEIPHEPADVVETATGDGIGQLLWDLNRAGQTLALVTHRPELAATSTHSDEIGRASCRERV